MKENKKQSNESQTKNSKETTRNLETKTDSFNISALRAKQEYTDEIIRKVFIKNSHHKDGGALGILLPKEVKAKIGLKRGDYVFIKASNDFIIIRKCMTNGALS